MRKYKAIEAFDGVVRAVNETLPKNRRFELEVRRVSYTSNAILRAGRSKKWVLSKWAGSDKSQKDAVEKAVSGLALKAAALLGFPHASSYEEVKLKLAVGVSRP